MRAGGGGVHCSFHSVGVRVNRQKNTGAQTGAGIACRSGPPTFDRPQIMRTIL
ncbi:hypothetical protein MYA_5357 [Burkholderia sp. KJ006]|nr:hypothetical protein MYA_5357 [Burkholderia sp. KJ006]